MMLFQQVNLYGYHKVSITGNREIHKGLRECKSGYPKGRKFKYKPETIEKMRLRSLEVQIEKLNNEREERLRKIRFELTLNRTDISRQRKNQLIKELPLRYDKNVKAEKLRNKELEKFEKLLNKQSKLKIIGKVWLKYEQKLQEMIEVL